MYFIRKDDGTNAVARVQVRGSSYLILSCGQHAFHLWGCGQAYDFSGAPCHVHHRFGKNIQTLLTIFDFVLLYKPFYRRTLLRTAPH